MSQPKDTIRPRYRRRSLAPQASPAANRADQSTRILIRVPWIPADGIQSDVTALRKSAEFSATGARSAPPTAETTSGTRSGSAVTETLAKRPTSPTVTADNVRSMPQVNPERIVRIDSGHTDESTSPSRPAVWGAWQGGLIPRLLERNSLLATAAIIVVVALVVVRLNHRNGRSEPAGLRNASSASPTIVDQKTDSPRQITKISPMERGANMHPPAERSASERGRGSAKIPAVPTASQSPELPNPGHLKGIRTPAENESPSGPSGWNLPAAANAPAAIEAQAPQTNSRRSSPTATDGASFNLARREDPVPTRGIAPRQTPGDNGAVMLGIEKAPFEVPR